MDRQLDEGRVINGLSPVRDFDGASLCIFGQNQQFDLAVLQCGERRGARLQSIDRVAGQQQGISAADQAQATGQTIIAEGE